VVGAWAASGVAVAVPYLLHRPLTGDGYSMNVTGAPGGFFVSLVWNSRK
jgi:hypothetical protein